MKVILLMLMLVGSIFAAGKAVSAHIDGEVKTAEVLIKKAFYYRCLNGYMWIQFTRVVDYGDINKSATIAEEGLPIQMFRESAFSKASIPVSCDW